MNNQEEKNKLLLDVIKSSGQIIKLQQDQIIDLVNKSPSPEPEKEEEAESDFDFVVLGQQDFVSMITDTAIKIISNKNLEDIWNAITVNGFKIIKVADDDPS